MRIADRIAIVGSGRLGLGLTHPLDCNVYLVDGGSELALVDAGVGLDAASIVARIAADGFDPARVSRIVLTHGHADHAGGAARLTELLGQPPIAAAPRVAKALAAADEAWLSIDFGRRAGIYPEDYRLQPCAVTEEIADGDALRVGDLTLRVVATPGHADGHVCLLLSTTNDTALFSGDTLFAEGTILLQPTHDCRIDEHVRSLRRLRSLDATSLYPGHHRVAPSEGRRHIELANQALDLGSLPDSVRNLFDDAPVAPDAKEETSRRMSSLEIDAFLAGNAQMRLASLTPEGNPYAAVCWFEWDGEAFWIIGRERSRWAEHLSNDPRVAFVIDERYPVRRVSGSGHAEVIESPGGKRWLDIAYRMANRYAGPRGPGYVQATSTQPRWLFRISPASMTSWQGSGWASRYLTDEPRPA